MKNQTIEQLFNNTTNAFIDPIRQWQRTKPKQRTALVFIRDNEAGQWIAGIYTNPRAKYPKGVATEAIYPYLEADPEFADWLEACIRCVRREQKREAISRGEGTV